MEISSKHPYSEGLERQKKSLESEGDVLKRLNKQFKNASVEKLKFSVKGLEILCQNIDPFRAEWDATITNLLEHFKIFHFSADPFQLTRIILSALNDAQSELKRRSQ